MPTWCDKIRPVQAFDIHEKSSCEPFCFYDTLDPETGRGIEGINLHVRRGSITVITGQVASGKTTLLRAVLGLLPKDAGEIYWNGVLVSDPETFFVPPRSAYTAQIPKLFSMTVKENILFGRDDNAHTLQQAMHTAVLEHDIESFEHGIDERIGVRGVRLSGGQIQRVAAARMVSTRYSPTRLR